MVADTIAAPIEQQVNGVERMLYMSSQSTNDGNYVLTVTFEVGSDLNMSQVLVQNRVALAMPLLPPQVQLQGVSTKKKSPNILFTINLISPDGRFNDLSTEQLRHDPRARRVVATARRRRHHLYGPARLQHAHVAGSR